MAEGTVADLRVDYDRLTTSQRVLGGLKTEFDNLETAASDSLVVWSHSSVRDAVGEFTGNMDYNRKKLSQRLQDCHDKIETTLETFREADAELARQFDEED